MIEWIELFKSIGKDVKAKVSPLAGSNKAKEVLGRGEFGDNTVYIDRLSEDIVVERILKSGFNCSILTEEKGWIELGAKYPIVIVDPLDGSLNAKRGIPYFAVSIGVAFGDSIDTIKCGYVLNLSNSDEFWAVEGGGAFLNGVRLKNSAKEVSVVAVEGIKRETEKGTVIKIFSSFYRVRQSGSTALDICYTASSAFDAFLHLDPARVVDYAAGKIILEESGGGFFEWLRKVEFTAEVNMEKTKPFMAVPHISSVDRLIKRLT